MKKILVVEDDTGLLEMLDDLLVEAGHEVRAVGSGTAALHALQSYQADVVVSDLALPDVPGEVIARAAANRSPVPWIVLMSGRVQRLRSATALADAVILKPFRLDEMRQLIDQYE